MKGGIETDNKKSGVGKDGTCVYNNGGIILIGKNGGIILIGGKNIKVGNYNCFNLKVAEGCANMV